MGSTSDRVNKVSHYNALPIECIDVIKYFDLPIGNVIKYCWRAGLKKEEGISDIDKEIEDLRKAEYYLKCKITMLEEQKAKHEGKHVNVTFVRARKPYTTMVDGKDRVTVRIMDSEDYAEAVHNPFVTNIGLAKENGLIPVLIYGEEMFVDNGLSTYNAGIIFAGSVDEAKKYFEEQCGKWAVCYSGLEFIATDGSCDKHALVYACNQVEFSPESEWRI
jgi:hypothetical protein